MSGSHVSLSSELQSPHMASPLGGPGLQTHPPSLPGAPPPGAEPPLASPAIPSPLPLLPPIWGFAKVVSSFMDAHQTHFTISVLHPSSKRPCPQEALLDPCCPKGRSQPCRCFAPSPHSFSASAVVYVGGCARACRSWPQLSETAFACSPVPTGWHTPGMTEAAVRVGRVSERLPENV